MLIRFFLMAGLVLPMGAQILFDGFTAERLMREDVKTRKRELLTTALQFSNDEQSRAFWRIHRDYESEVSQLNDRAFALLNRYTKSGGSMEPAQSAEITRESLRLDKARIDIRQKYLGRIAKAVSPAIASRFIQLESLFHSVLFVQLAMNVPLNE